LAEVGDRAAPADVHAEGPRSPFQHGVEAGLVEHRREGPSGRPQADAAQAEQRGPLAVAPLVDVGGLGDLGQLGADAGRLEDAADLVVEVDRPGQRIGLRLALEDGDGMAVLGQQDRQREPHGSAADHDDVAGGGHG
jgi:hypothetical protein